MSKKYFVMKMYTEQLNLLREVGLTDYEARCYLALMQYRKLTARECAKIANIPPTKTHETLRELADKGLISITNDKPMLFCIIPIERGFVNYIERRKNLIEHLEKELIISLKKIKTVEREEITPEKINVVSGRERQHELALNMTKGSLKEILIISKGESLPYKLLIESKRAMDRGVKIKYIITKIKGNEKIIKKLKELGYKIRYLALGDLFIAIGDRKKSLLVVKNPNNPEDRISISLFQNALAKAHAKYFDEMWKKAQPI
jgi:sugar-specific transcriptional regulator TrmB